MRDMLEVGIFTVKEVVKKKVFLVTNIIILAIILILLNIPNILKTFDIDPIASLLENVVIIDSENVLEGNLLLLDELELPIVLEIKNEVVSNEAINKYITDDDKDYVIDISRGDFTFNIDYISNSDNLSQSGEFLISTIESIYKDLQIGKLDLTPSEVSSINPIIDLNIINLDSEVETNESSEFIGTIMSLIIFLSIYLFAYQVSGAVTTEKTSKIIETLLTSTSSKNIILGKTLGIGLLGITQVLVIILFILVGAHIFLPSNIVNLILGEISVMVVVISFIYFILGYLLYSFLFALSGAMVNRLEDVSIVNTPVNLLAVLGFYLGYFTLLDPTGALNKLAAYIPISSMFAMPSRYFMGIATTFEVVISIIILIITIIIIAYISIRIYSNAILNNGSKMSIKELIKLYKQKDIN